MNFNSLNTSHANANGDSWKQRAIERSRQEIASRLMA